MAVVYRQPQIISIYRKVLFSAVTSGADINMGEVPLGAAILHCRTIIRVGFNSSGTDLWRAGISAGGIEFVNDMDASVVGVTDHAQAMDYSPLVANRTIYGRYTAGGTAPTAGELHFILLAHLK